MHTHAGPSRPRYDRLTACLLGLAVVLAAAHTGPGHAQSGALQASDPAHPAQPVQTPAMPSAATPAGPQPASERSAALAIWQQANARVAEFPRGHIDILRWEASQANDRTAATAQAASDGLVPMADLVAQALRLRPDLIDQPGLSPQERGARRAELAEAVREVQGAWLKAVAARARLTRATDLLENARTGAELGRRMVVATDMQRRHFFAGAAPRWPPPSVSRVALAALPEAVQQTSADTAAPWTPPGVTGAGRPYNPVVTLNGWTLPWRMNNGVKEFHLVAEPVVREMAPGFLVNMWGYNGQSPGPTIEVVEGDKVRIFVTNRLPEHTTIHWHGQRLPNGMDGVGGLNQPQIPAGQDLCLRVRGRAPAPSCTTRTPTKWCRWPWA
jgi:hypothetical protein